MNIGLKLAKKHVEELGSKMCLYVYVNLENEEMPKLMVMKDDIILFKVEFKTLADMLYETKTEIYFHSRHIANIYINEFEKEYKDYFLT